MEIDAWEKQAELIAQYVKKGRPLLVEGRLKLDTWEDKNTKEKRSRLGVVLESFQFLGDGQGRGAEGGGGFDSASSGSSRPRPAASGSSAAPTGARSEPEAMPPEDDDVPF